MLNKMPNKNIFSLENTSKDTKNNENSIVISSFAELRQTHINGQKSLHATARFEPNEIVVSFELDKILIEPNYLSIQADENKHCMINPEYLHYINHGCDPNVFFDMDKMQLSCIRSIKIGDEFTFLYPSTDWQMIQQFKCNCNSLECLGSIRGASYLTRQQLQKYKLSSFINQKIGSKSFV